MKLKAILRFSGAFACLLLIAACAESSPRQTKMTELPAARPTRPPSQLPSLESHLAADWISAVTRIPCGDSVIYYHGSANQKSAAGEAWTGKVRGDILLLSPQSAILIPSGALMFSAGHRIQISGASRTIIAKPTETPKWRALLKT